MHLQCLDHVHFSVPDLARAKRIYGPFLNGRFVDDYGGPAVNAYGAWHTSGGDFIQVIDPAKPVFGGSTIPSHGMLSVSFRVADVDAGIAEAKAHGLVVRSRVGSEDIGLGKNVVQAQLLPEPVSGLPFELIEHQLPGEYVPMTEAAVEYVELELAPGVALDAAVGALEPILGSAFEAERVERGVASRLHRGLGLWLVRASASDRPGARAHVEGSGARAGQREARSAAVGRAAAGLRAIALRCPSLERAIAAAADAGLAVADRFDAGGEPAVELEPWAGVALRLIESDRPRRASA